MKLTIHPLFFVFGLYFALTGKVFLFLTFTLTALMHEYGHALAAERLGYKMNKITLMPYGAVINGAIDGLSYKDEVTVALAGPLTNLFICILFTAAWWLVPEIYPYTDTVLFANLSVAAINILPAYPLDGGRIVAAALSLKFPQKKMLFAMKIIGTVIGATLFAAFVFSLFNTPNISLLFFSLFILVGALKKTDERAYVKTYSKKIDRKGVKECKKLLVGGNVLLKTLMSKTVDEYAYSLEIVDQSSGKTRTLSTDETQELLASYRYYDRVADVANDIE